MAKESTSCRRALTSLKSARPAASGSENVTRAQFLVSNSPPFFRSDMLTTSPYSLNAAVTRARASRAVGQSERRGLRRGTRLRALPAKLCGSAPTLNQILFFQIIDDAQPIAVYMTKTRWNVAHPDRRRLFQVRRGLHCFPRAARPTSHMRLTHCTAGWALTAEPQNAAARTPIALPLTNSSSLFGSPMGPKARESPREQRARKAGARPSQRPCAALSGRPGWADQRITITDHVCRFD